MTRIVHPKTEQIAHRFGARLSEALETAGLSAGQLASLIHHDRHLVRRWAEGFLVPTQAEDVVAIAELLNVDALWLARGELCAQLAIEAIQVRRAFDGKKVRGDDLEAVMRIVERRPHAADLVSRGICRYCGCTQNRACLGATLQACRWVDDGATICSACVEVQ